METTKTNNTTDFNSSITNFLNEYKGLVISVAKKYKTKVFAQDELVNFGNEGLLDAKEKFDSSFGVPFKTFAYRYIENAIKNEINEYKNPLNVSSNNIEYSKSINNYINNYYIENGQEPSVDNIKDYINDKYQTKFNSSDIHILMQNYTCDSFDREIDENLTLSDVVSSNDNPCENYNKIEVNDNIEYMCNILNDTEKYVVLSTFGLLGYKQINMREISNILNISVNNVNKTFNDAMTKLKNKFKYQK